jgi:ATP-dependent DNA helicase
MKRSPSGRKKASTSPSSSSKAATPSNKRQKTTSSTSSPNRKRTAAQTKTPVDIEKVDITVILEGETDEDAAAAEAEKMLQIELEAIAEKEDKQHEDWKEDNEFQVKATKFVKELTFQQKVEKLEDLMSKAEAYAQFLANRHKESVEARRLGNKSGKDMAFKQPPNMTGGVEKLRLRDYQELGAQWLEGLVFNGLNGILADEMGLGKTIQVIAVIAHLIHQGMKGPFLVVAPLSTLRNWEFEFHRWCPTIPTCLYHGTKAEREELRQNKMGMTKSKNGVSHRKVHGLVEDMPVIITSYDILMRDIANFRKFEWAYLVVDEGHRLKNKDCRLMRELKSLETHQRLLLTGTPLQNNLSELWSLLNFLMPEAFDDLSFFQAWFGWDSREEDEMTKKITKGAESDDIVNKLHRILSPFMMRRLKTDVTKELPDKKEIVVYVGMTEAQNQLYNMILSDMSGLSKMLTKNSQTQGKRSAKGLMNQLMQLRKCCNHPYLFADQDETDENLVNMSGKLKLMDTLMTKFFKDGHKVLIFSQFTSMLDIIQDYFWLRKWLYKVCRIDGSVKLDERQKQINDFNDDKSEKSVFLLSTRAGGVGINLASADTVIIFDSDWNPHMDTQAQDRAHRIGQKKNVMIYRLVTEGSVELKILERANAKRSLERLAMAGNFGSHSKTKKATRTEVISTIAKEVVDDLLSKDINITEAQREGSTGGITKSELALILNRDLVCGRVKNQTFPMKGRGYELVEHKATLLVGTVDHGANTAELTEAKASSSSSSSLE